MKYFEKVHLNFLLEFHWKSLIIYQLHVLRIIFGEEFVF